MNFCHVLRISWSVWVKFGVRDLHLPSLRIYESGDNRYGGSYTGKSLARRGRKQATAAEDFDFRISYL